MRHATCIFGAMHRRKHARIIEWNTNVQLGTTVRHGKRTLVIALQKNADDGVWGVLALETGSARRSKAVSLAEATNNVLNDHSHQVVGIYRTLGEAIVAGEAYAKSWVPGKHANCTCDEINSPGKTRTPRRRMASKP